MTLYGKNDWEGAIKIRILRWGECPGLSWWVQCSNDKGPDERKAENRVRKERF